MRKFQFSLRTLVVGVLVVCGLLWLSAWHFDWGHGPAETVSHLRKLSENSLREQLGPPDNELDDLTFDPPVDKMLISPFTLRGKGSGEGVDAKEWVWQYHAYSVNVVLVERGGEWRAMEAYRLQKGARHPFRSTQSE